MENNASSAGVRLGGLFNTTEIRILICYIHSAIREPIPVNMLANVLHYEGIANAFEVCDAVAALEKNGQLSPADENGDTYIITKSGIDIANTLNTALSMTVKQRAYAATIKMLSRFKNAKETEFQLDKENDSTYITCSILDGEKPFMSLKLMVADEGQALCIKEKFLNNPSEIYSSIIAILTKKDEED